MYTMAHKTFSRQYQVNKSGLIILECRSLSLMYTVAHKNVAVNSQ